MTGLNLNYIEKGQGRTLLLVPGWSQTANATRSRSTAFPTATASLPSTCAGMAIRPSHRLAIASRGWPLTFTFVLAHDLRDIALGGHSIGASIVSSYLEQFGADRIASSSTSTKRRWLPTASAVRPPRSRKPARRTPLRASTPRRRDHPRPSGRARWFERAFFSPSISDATWFNKAEALKMPAICSPPSGGPWRTGFAGRDDRPASDGGKVGLVVGGALGTVFPPESLEWIAANPGAKLALFSAEELGSHFMFSENPAFNAGSCANSSGEATNSTAAIRPASHRLRQQPRLSPPRQPRIPSVGGEGREGPNLA